MSTEKKPTKKTTKKIAFCNIFAYLHKYFPTLSETLDQACVPHNIFLRKSGITFVIPDDGAIKDITKYSEKIQKALLEETDIDEKTNDGLYDILKNHIFTTDFASDGEVGKMVSDKNKNKFKIDGFSDKKVDMNGNVLTLEYKRKPKDGRGGFSIYVSDKPLKKNIVGGHDPETYDHPVLVWTYQMEHLAMMYDKMSMKRDVFLEYLVSFLKWLQACYPEKYAELLPRISACPFATFMTIFRPYSLVDVMNNLVAEWGMLLYPCNFVVEYQAILVEAARIRSGGDKKDAPTIGATTMKNAIAVVFDGYGISKPNEELWQDEHLFIFTTMFDTIQRKTMSLSEVLQHIKLIHPGVDFVRESSFSADYTIGLTPTKDFIQPFVSSSYYRFAHGTSCESDNSDFIADDMTYWDAYKDQHKKSAEAGAQMLVAYQKIHEHDAKPKPVGEGAE
jgi:hypothetical protein|uniref:Uncharacterized protein n=1 Tax=viral metagenome TaxID=1070528 RepID=A0A6C0IUP1_9ZZZZ